MAAESICDGCGKRAPMIAGRDGAWHKPELWIERARSYGLAQLDIQTACSIECVEKIVERNSSEG